VKNSAAPGRDVIEIISPHDETLVGTVPEGTEADVDRAVTAAPDAFDNGDWPRMAPAERIAIVSKFAELYAAQMMDMAAVITDEMGSPISFSQLAQTPAPWMMLNTFIQVATEHEWEEKRQGVLGSEVSFAARASASSARSFRGTCRSSSRCRSWHPRCSPVARSS